MLQVRAGHRVAVIDIDVHHGNGTQSIFYHRADVLTGALCSAALHCAVLR